ncbi:MAG: DUF2203 domain-containing protein [Verrucomicrobiota bacterium]
MSHHFSKHYSVEEARALLPQIRQWLEQIEALKTRLGQLDIRIDSLISGGNDVGGETVNSSIKTHSEMQTILQEFAARQIQIKDLSRGLIDFPALREGREVFLCWEKDDEDIEFWHDLETGYPGRERLE